MIFAFFSKQFTADEKAAVFDDGSLVCSINCLPNGDATEKVPSEPRNPEWDSIVSKNTSVKENGHVSSDSTSGQLIDKILI